MHDTSHDTVACAPPPPFPSVFLCPRFCPLGVLLGSTWLLVGVLPSRVGGGVAPDVGSGPSLREFPHGGADACTPRQGVTLLYGPSICTRSVQMDLRRNHVCRPLPTPGRVHCGSLGSPCGIGASLAYPDGRRALPAAPHRTRTAVRAVGSALGQAHWPPPQAGATSGRWPTVPGVTHLIACAQVGPIRTPGGGPKPLRSGTSPASFAGSCHPRPPPVRCGVGPCLPASFSRGVPLSRAPCRASSFLPCPVRPCCLPLLWRIGVLCFFFLPPPLATRLSPRRFGLSSAPPPPPCPLAVSSLSSPRSWVGGGVGGGASSLLVPWRKHVASTVQARGAAPVPLQVGGGLAVRLPSSPYPSCGRTPGGPPVEACTARAPFGHGRVVRPAPSLCCLPTLPRLPRGGVRVPLPSFLTLGGAVVCVGGGGAPLSSCLCSTHVAGTTQARRKHRGRLQCIYIYIYIYIYVHTHIYISSNLHPSPNSRWLHHTALRYVRRAQSGAYMWWKGLNSVKTGSKWAQNTWWCTSPPAPQRFWGAEYTTALDAIKSICGCDLAWRPVAVYRLKVVLSPELTASSAASLGRVVQSPHSDVAWLEPHRYCSVPVATKVTSPDASPQGDDATNVAVASHKIPTWTGAMYGTVPEAEIIGAAAYLLHTPPSACTVHVVDASIIGAHLRRAQEALYRGIKGLTSHLVNQHALSWIVEGLRRLPRRVGGPHHWVVRQSSHLAAVLFEVPDSAAAHAMAPPVHLVLPKEHAILLVPGDNGELEPRVPSMQTLQHVREMEWRSLAARTRAHTPLAGACEAVPLGAVHHGPTHRNMLRARDGRLSTMQVMRRWRQKLTRMAIPAHPCIFCGGPEEDIGHMRLLCAWKEEVARLLCRRLEEFTAELPLTDRAVEFVAWREHGCRWTESLMAGVVPGDLKRQFAAVRAASSRGSAKARLFVEDMVQIGEDVYARRNHRLTQIMQLPMQDRRRAVYAFLRGDTPFCPPAGRIQRRPPWNPFAGLPGDLRATFQRAPLHALLVPRSCIAHEEAMSLFPHWMAAVAQAFSQWIGSWVARDITAFREWSRVVSAQSWALVRGTMVRSPDGQSDPWLQVYANHPAVGNVMGSPREVLPVL